MNSQFEITSTVESHPVAVGADSFRPEYATESITGGITSFPLHLLKRTVIAAGIAVIGTIPPPVEDIDPAYGGIEASFVFPSSSEPSAEDEYSRIREEMVASGLPMLSDDEVRAEIRERRGVGGEPES